MKFDVIVGNPPYQMNDGGHGASATPIYQHFVSKGKEIADKMVMITPARWYAGGKGLDDYRAEMLADTKLAKLVDYIDSRTVFEGVDIAGGISYFLWDKKHNGKGCKIIPEGDTTQAVRRPLNQFNILIRHNKAIPIIEKVLNTNTKYCWLNNRIQSLDIFKFPTNYNNFSDEPDNGKVAIYHRYGKGWIEENRVLPEWNKEEKREQRHNLIHLWKVIMSKAAFDHGGQPDKNGKRRILAKVETLPPPSCCTQTYLIAGLFETKTEAENYVTYLKTKFVRFLAGLYATTQNINRKQFVFVPDLPMNKKWSDAELYSWTGLTQEEIAFIESQIKEMP